MHREDDSSAYVQEEALYSQITEFTGEYHHARPYPPFPIAHRRDLYWKTAISIKAGHSPE
jgi:hypothetical protein